MANISQDCELIIRPTKGLRFVDLHELWRYRELLMMLVKRDIYGKYRQSALGFLWAFVPPLLQMVVFTAIFGRVAKLGPEGVPYPIFSYVALVPWTYFTRALSNSSESLLVGKNLFSKVYFPRLVLPLTSVISGLFDFVIAFVVLLALMAWYGTIPGWAILTIPFFLIVTMITALGVGTWLTALSVKYRDVAFVTPFLIQLWFFVTPVVFAVEKIPPRYQFLLWLNPMTGVIEGFRWAFIGQSTPNWQYAGLSLAVVVTLFVTGLVYFKSTEKTFADLI